MQDLKRGGAPLLVVITDSSHPILSAQARAQLVAGLACVDHVTEAAVTPAIRLEQEHEASLAHLIDHVRQRREAAG